jgi:hypothetical protein
MPTFPGFDTSGYPGDAAMQTWKASSPYIFVAYYIQSPCHHNAGWMGKRATLTALGWNLLPVYVGQLVVGSSGCTNNVLTAAQGQIDGQDAATKLTGDGFAAGSFVYLDIERCDVLPDGMKDYAGAWVQNVVNAGFAAGVYCHKHNAPDLQAAIGNARYWIAGGVTAQFNVTTSNPSDSGIAFADLWQRPEPISRTFGGVTILVDEDVSSFADPGGPIPT